MRGCPSVFREPRLEAPRHSERPLCPEIPTPRRNRPPYRRLALVLLHQPLMAPTGQPDSYDPNPSPLYVVGDAGTVEEDSGSPKFSLLSLVHAIWKQRWWVVSIWVAISIATPLIVRLLPPVYHSEAVVLLESQRIPKSFVSPTTVDSDLWQRLNSLIQKVLSHTRLTQVVSSFNLYAEEAEDLTPDELVAIMRDDITVEMETGLGQSDRPPAFRVGYSAPDPDVAAQVANRLAGLFIARDLETRALEVESTADFLESQVQAARAQLETQEARVSRYKSEHNGELPEQEVSLQGGLARLEARLEANRESIRRAQQDKLFTQSSLREAISSADALRVLAEQVGSGGDALDLSTGSAVAPRELALREMQSDLVELQRHYSDQHPDVRRLAAELQAMEESLKDQDPSGAASGDVAQSKDTAADLVETRQPKPFPLNPFQVELRRREEKIAELQTRLDSLDLSLDTLQAAQERTAIQIAGIDARVRNLPIREQEMASLIRDYEITKENYQSLLQKRLDAEVAMEMELRQKSEKFVLLEPARTPAKPASPNVLRLSGIGSALGLLLGVAVGLAIELRSNVVLGEWELPRHLPVLARVPTFSVGGNELGARDTRGRADLSIRSTGTLQVAFSMFALGDTILTLFGRASL